MRAFRFPIEVKPTFIQEEWERTLQLAQSSGRLIRRDIEGSPLEHAFNILLKSYGIPYNWSKHCRQWKKKRGHVSDFIPGRYWIELKNWKDDWRSQKTIRKQIVSRFRTHGVGKFLLTTDRKTNPRKLRCYRIEPITLLEKIIQELKGGRVRK